MTPFEPYLKTKNLNNIFEEEKIEQYCITSFTMCPLLINIFEKKKMNNVVFFNAAELCSKLMSSYWNRCDVLMRTHCTLHTNKSTKNFQILLPCVLRVQIFSARLYFSWKSTNKNKFIRIIYESYENIFSNMFGNFLKKWKIFENVEFFWKFCFFYCLVILFYNFGGWKW